MRKWYIALVALGCACLAGCASWLPHGKEPKYQGKPLRYWVASYWDHAHPVSPPADEAVRHIGTNALPFLLKWMRWSCPAWYGWVDTVADRMPEPIRGCLISCKKTKGEQLYVGTFETFRALGPVAAPAIPELALLTRDPDLGDRAVGALALIGTNSVPALLAAAQDPEFRVSFAALNALTGRMPTNTPVNETIGPVLLKIAREGRDFRARTAAVWLGSRRYDPEVGVPALLERLQTVQPDRAIATSAYIPDVNLSGLRPPRSADLAAVVGLGEYGASAASALPALTNTLSDPDPIVRFQTTNAIRKITTQVATNTPAH